jgi:hypothetical protein
MLGKEKPGGKLITSHSSGLSHLQIINVTSFGGSMALRWFENTRQGEARRKNNNISH